MNCDMNECPVVQFLKDNNIDALVAGLREEKRLSAGLLNDGACLCLFMDKHAYDVDKHTNVFLNESGQLIAKEDIPEGGWVMRLSAGDRVDLRD